MNPRTAKMPNKGTGAGGSNTNKNGLPYEEFTDLKSNYKTIHVVDNIIEFNGHSRTFIKADKSNLHKYMNKTNQMNKELIPAQGCKQPDEAYIDDIGKKIFIIEKKFQQTSGSVDEKIQTGPFKKYHYEELFPKFKIYYMYCLSDWFKKEEYKSVLNYLKINSIPIFWGSSETY